MDPKPPRFIVKRGNRYLVSTHYYGQNKTMIWLKMSTSAYDAWSSPHFNNALRLANLIQGHVCKFTQINGDIVDYGATSLKSKELESDADITVVINNTTYILREEKC